MPIKPNTPADPLFDWEEQAQSQGLSEYLEIWQDITSRLDFTGQFQFSLYIKLKQIEKQFRDLNEEFSEMNGLRVEKGETLPINVRAFLQVFLEEEQWNQTLRSLSLENDALYFKIVNRTSAYLNDLINEVGSESELMILINRVYKSEYYAALYKEISERYAKAQVLPPGKTPQELIIEKHMGHMRGRNLEGLTIMSEKEYERMIGYVNEFFPECNIPKDVKKISMKKLPNNYLWPPFHRIFRDLQLGNHYPKDLFRFITLLFPQIDWSDEYTSLAVYKKFSEEPSNYSALLQKNT